MSDAQSLPNLNMHLSSGGCDPGEPARLDLDLPEVGEAVPCGTVDFALDTALACDGGNGSGGIGQEADPIFRSSAVYGISQDMILHWEEAYGWGNHAEAGYEKNLVFQNALTRTGDIVEFGGTLLHDTLVLGGTAEQVEADMHFGMWWRDLNYWIVQGKYLATPGQPSFQVVYNDNSFTQKFWSADNDINFYSNWSGSSFMEQINDHGNFQLERYSGVSSTGIDRSYLKHGYEAEYMTWDPTGVYEVDTTEAWMMIKGSGGKGRIKLLHLSQGQVQPSDGGNGDQYATGYLATEEAVLLFCGKIDEAQIPWYDDPNQLAYQKGIKINYGGDLTFGMYPNTRNDGPAPMAFYPDANGNIKLGSLNIPEVDAGDFIQNQTTTPQINAGFNIDGSGTLNILTVKSLRTGITPPTPVGLTRLVVTDTNGQFSSVAAPDIQGSQIMVDKNHPNATDNRIGLSKYSQNNPFKTIQAAYTAAVSGDVITVSGGAYAEDVIDPLGAKGNMVITFVLYSSSFTSLAANANNVTYYLIGYGTSSIGTITGWSGNTKVFVNNVALTAVSGTTNDSFFRNMVINTSASLWPGTFEDCDITSTHVDTSQYNLGGTIYDMYVLQAGVTFRRCRITHANGSFVPTMGGLTSLNGTAVFNFEYCTINVSGNFLASRGTPTINISWCRVTFNGYLLHNDGGQPMSIKIRESYFFNSGTQMFNLLPGDTLEWVNSTRDKPLGNIPTNSTFYGTDNQLNGDTGVSGMMLLANKTADPTGVSGGMIYNPTTRRGRIHTGTDGWQNLTTDNYVAGLLVTGKIIYVDTLNANATDNRIGLSKYSQTAPFKTIQAAVNATQGNLKEILYIRAGTYSENVVAEHGVNVQWGYDQNPTIVLDGATVDGGASSAFTFLGNMTLRMFVLNGSTIKNTGNLADKDGTAALRTHDAQIAIYGNSVDLSVIQSVDAHAVKVQSGGAYRFERMTLSSVNGSGLQSLFVGSVYVAHSVLSSTNSSGLYGGAKAELNTCIVSGADGIDFINIAPEHNYYNCTITGTTGAAIKNTEMGSSSQKYGVAYNCTFRGYNNTLNWRSSSNVHLFQFDNCKFILTGPAVTAALYWDEPWHSGGAGSITKTNNCISTHPLFTDWLRTNHPTKIKESNTNTTDTIFFGINTGFGVPLPTSQVHVKGTLGYNQLRIETNYTPTGSADANGAVGDMAFDDDYIYRKTAAGWKRSAIFTTF